MYVDFDLNLNGDLIFAEQNRYCNPLKISFNYSQSKVQKIIFNIQNAIKENNESVNTLKIQFEINKQQSDNYATTLTDDNFLIHMIKLKMNTVLGELPERSEFGSLISSFKHNNINEKTLTQLSKYVEALLKDDIYNPKVIATPKINYENGYRQAVLLQIYTNGTFLTDIIINN